MSMSFRIEDILKDKCSHQEENGSVDKKREDQSCFQLISYKNLTTENVFLERDRDKFSNYKISSYIDYPGHCLPYLGSQPLGYARGSFPDSFVSSRPMKNYSSRSLAVENRDKIYSAPYTYPEKIYPQTTYNHILPLSFPIYNHYSKRRNQVRFSTSQTKALEHKFSWQKYLSPEDRKLLAFSLKLSDRQVKTWFQNRRAKWRRNVNGSSNGDIKQDIPNPIT